MRIDPFTGCVNLYCSFSNSIVSNIFPRFVTIASSINFLSSRSHKYFTSRKSFFPFPFSLNKSYKSCSLPITNCSYFFFTLYIPYDLKTATPLNRSHTGSFLKKVSHCEIELHYYCRKSLYSEKSVIKLSWHGYDKLIQ